MILAASATSNAPWWLTLLVAAIPTVAAIVAAIIAGRYAKSSKMSELEAQRLRELEHRNSERKYEVYKPMIEGLSGILTKDNAEQQRALKRLPADAAKFSTWISIYGSDESIRAFQRFMQATFSSAPGKLLIRLYADFILAARRDIGYSSTTATALDILGMRINDVYRDNMSFRMLTEPFESVCKEYDWTPPWVAKSRLQPNTAVPPQGRPQAS